MPNAYRVGHVDPLLKLLSVASVFAAGLCLSVVACAPVDDPDEKMDAPCDAMGQCLPGWVCVRGFCIAGEVTPDGPRAVGPEGGTVDGPAGFSIEVPPGALSDIIELEFGTLSKNTPVENTEVLAEPVSIGPAEVAFGLEATVIIPIPTSSTSSVALSPSSIAVWRADTTAGPWVKLWGASSSTLAIGLTDKVGIFVAATDK